MGKRELFIAIAFIVVGVCAYQITAPPPKPGQEGFSFSKIWDNARRGMRSNAVQASVTKKAVIAAPASLTAVRIEGFNRQVRVIGEARSDITYELTVESTGPDNETAAGYAKATTLKQDDLGSALTLRVTYPQGGRQVATLLLRVPSRMGVFIAGGSGVDASNLSSVHFDNVSGDSAVSGIAGALTGRHTNGSLKVSGVGSVKMTLQRSRATFERVLRGLTLDARDGECHILDSKGAVELDETRADVTITGHEGPIRVGGSEGRVTLTDPHEETKVDVRRAEIEVTLLQSVPLTLLTTDDTLRLVLDGPPRVSVDAVANLGKIQATDFALPADTVDQESRLSHVFGAAGGPRVSLRNLRGDIVIRNLRGAIENRKSK